MKITGTQAEIDFIENLIKNPMEDYECDGCPVEGDCQPNCIDLGCYANVIANGASI